MKEIYVLEVRTSKNTHKFRYNSTEKAQEEIQEYLSKGYVRNINRKYELIYIPISSVIEMVVYRNN